MRRPDIIHISAWAKTFTQFRMPLLRALRDFAGRQTLYCPYHPEHVRRLKSEGFEVVNSPISERPEGEGG